MATHYESPPEKRSEALNLRVTKKLKEHLLEVQRLWVMLAKARGENYEAVDISYTASRLLQVGVDGAFEEFGGRPRSEADWKLLQERINENPQLGGPK